ncbi:hypothetical protein ABPG75_013013 [Micractinium tetrahymenae]
MGTAERLQSVKAALQRATCPCVMVIASPAVEASCTQRNGLALAELLRPFGVIRQLNGSVGVPVRTPAEHPLRLHSWRLRFYASDTMFQPAPEAADAYLRDEVLGAAAAEAATSEVADVQELLAAAGGRGEAAATPWFSAYRREYLRLMQFGEHETLDHPVACVLALPADAEGDLAAAFAALWRHSALPPLMQAGVMEAAGVLRHYVLVHDAASMGPEVLLAAQEKLRQLAATLGSSCQVLTINSGSGAGAPVGPRLWQDMLHGCLPGGGGGEPAAGSRSPAPPGGLGAWLSEADMAGLAAFVHELAARHVIPHLESRLRALNVQVTANRRGLKNQLKSLLWRKGGGSSGSSSATAAASGPGSSGGQDSPRSMPGTPSATAVAAASASYAAGSVESHMRQLSDLALMLGDYETAASTLRLLASDTKADRAYKAYAGVQEALGAATVLSGAPPSEASAGYKEAVYRYSQLSQANPRNREGVRYATRAVLLFSDYLRAQRLHGEANQAYMKGHFQEDSLRAGLLLEQAAHCLLALAPPHTRKFAFHLVLAGLRYDMAEQKGLAQRCYRQVLGVYSGRRWALIEEHLHDALGRQARDAGDAPAAAQHFMAMLACPQNSLYCQRLYLTQFMEALGQAQEQLGFPPVLELPLPAVNCERVGLQHDGQTCYSGVEARQVAEHSWKALDATLQPALESHPSGNWLGGSRARLAELDDVGERSCCVGEPVGLDVELSNPLQLDLAVTHLRLACTWEPPAGARSTEGSPTPAPALAAAGGGSGEGSGQQAPQQAPQQAQQQGPGFQVHEESVTLHGGERVVVHLRVVPLRPGRLQVDGVAWLLNGAAHGKAAFAIPRPRPRKPGSSSKVLIDADRPAPGGVTFQVLPPMPRLEVSVSGLPPTLLAGEVAQCTLRLRNSGAMTLQHLGMAAALGGGGAAVFLGSGPAAAAAAGQPVAAAGAGAAGAGQQGSAQQAAVAAGTAEPADGGSGGSPPPTVRSPRSSLDGSKLHVAHSFRQGAAVFSLPPSVRLGVGQELTLPAWFRAPHAGTAHFALVWRYEPLVKLDALAHRSVRFARSVEALPSVHMAARLAAGVGGCAPGGCLVQVQVHNAASESLTLTGLACPSSHWRLCSGSDDGGGSRLEVPSDGSATLHRQLMPAGDVPAAAGAVAAEPLAAAGSSLNEAEAALLEMSRQVAAAAQAALPKHLRQQQQQPQAQPRRQRQEQQKQQHKDEGGLDVVVLWQAAGKGGALPRRGFCCVHNQRLHAAPPIDAQLRGPATLSFDFAGGAALCAVPLKLVLRNTLAAPAAVCIETGKAADGQPFPLGVPTWGPSPPAAGAAGTVAAAAGAADGGLPPSGSAGTAGASALISPASSAPVALAAPGALPPVRQYVWCGRTRLTLPAVQPGQVVEVPLQVAVTRPGKLALGDCLVSWHYAGPPHIAGSRAVPPHHCTVEQQQPPLLL